MQLEWFRHHKNFVYWILLPASVLSLAILYTADVSHKHSVSAKGPSITYPVDGVNYYLNPAQVIERRALLTKFGGHRGASSQDVARYIVQVETALHEGFEAGPEEVQEDMREIVRQRSGQSVAKEEYYKILLEQTKLTDSQFERMTRESSIINKYMGNLAEHIKASDGELFTAYAREKEVVRMRYKELKSEDFFNETKVPTDDKVKEYYDRNKTTFEKNKDEREAKMILRELKDVMFSKPKMSADVLYLDVEKLGAVKAEDSELQKYYDQFKDTYWKKDVKAGTPPPAEQDKYKPLTEVKADVEAKWREEQIKHFYELFKHTKPEWKIAPKPGEAPPKPGEERIKPFEEVKADATAKWEVDEKNKRATARMTKMKETIDEAEKTFEAEQAAKPAAEKKEFDIHAWAEKNGLAHWVTDELTEDEYKTKGVEEVNAKNYKPVNQLFHLFGEPEYPQMASFYKNQQKKFSYPNTIGKGIVIYRARKYVGEEPLTLDQAKEALVKRLRIEDSVDMAKKAADKLHDEWALGKNLPAIDTLDEVKGDSSSQHALVRQYFSDPKPVGEVADVAEDMADAKNPQSNNPNERFYVGFAVDRQLPSYAAFNADTNWDRDRERDKIRNGYWQFVSSVIQQTKKGQSSGEEDPPLVGGSGD